MIDYKWARIVAVVVGPYTPGLRPLDPTAALLV